MQPEEQDRLSALPGELLNLVSHERSIYTCQLKLTCNQIYSFVVDDEPQEIIVNLTGERLRREPFAPHINQNLIRPDGYALLQTNRKMRADFSQLYYSKNIIVIDMPPQESGAATVLAPDVAGA